MLVLLFRIMEEGFCWLGTPCSSWVSLSRSWSQRTCLSPEGPRHASFKLSKYLKLNNAVAIISALIIRTCKVLHIRHMVEQPRSSLLYRFKPMRLALCDADSCNLAMSSFGGTSPKPLKLMGDKRIGRTMRGVHLKLQKLISKPTGRLTKERKGTRYTGDKSALTESSAYTARFGRCVALAFLGETPQKILTLV